MFMYNEEFEAKILAGIKSVTDEWNDFYRKPIIMPFSPEKMAKIVENVPELNSAVEFFTREVTMEYASNGLGEWIRALDLSPLANSKYIKRFVDIENMEKAIEQIESANGLTRQAARYAVKQNTVLAEAISPARGSSHEKAIRCARASAIGLIKSGYTPKWLDEEFPCK